MSTVRSWRHREWWAEPTPPPSGFRAFHGVSDDLLHHRGRKRVCEFQVDGACAGLDARILGLELRDVVRTVGV